MSCQSERWRRAALEPYTDAPTTTDEWLRALELGADAAVRVVLEHLRDHSELFYWGPDSDWREEDAIPLYRVEKLLSEISEVAPPKPLVGADDEHTPRGQNVRSPE